MVSKADWDSCYDDEDDGINVDNLKGTVLQSGYRGFPMLGQGNIIQTMLKARFDKIVPIPHWSIVFRPSALRTLHAADNWARKDFELSGTGSLESVELPDHKTLHAFVIVHLEILSSGDTSGTTDIEPEDRLFYSKRAEARGINPGHNRLWFHRHPVESWSTDDIDQRIETLNGLPSGTWGLSVVKTPRGWLGAFDQTLNEKFYTAEIPVYVAWEHGGVEDQMALRYGKGWKIKEGLTSLSPAEIERFWGFEPRCVAFGGRSTPEECVRCTLSAACFAE